MAGAKIGVELVDDAGAMFARLIARGANLKPLLTELGSILEDGSKDRFRTQTDPTGAAWSPLSPTTLARKKTTRILFESGDLQSSIRSEVSDRMVEIIAGPTEYAATHQFGRADNKMFGKAKAPIPARPFLGLSDADNEEIRDATLEYFRRAIG